MEAIVKKFGLTNNQLKLIAMVAMLLDHLGKVVFPQYVILQIIGRISFPIFSFMIAEGCFYTKNKKRYLLTISLLALGCQVVYFFVEHSLYLNVLFTFAMSIFIIFAIENYKAKGTIKAKRVVIFSFVALLFVCYVLPVILKKYSFQVDYGMWGVLLPVVIYLAPDKPRKIVCAFIDLLLIASIYSGIQWYLLLSIPFLCLYNQKRGKHNIKLLFYVFYPAHFVLVYLLGMLIN